jgi:Mg-chelatase subunit ChlD
MPAYLIEFETREGPQRRRFTIDQERILEPQVRQILEELNQRGVVLAGGPDQELGVFWNGREVSTTQSPAQLGLAPERSLELRMRPRRREAVRIEVAPPEPLPAPTRPKGPYAAAVWGATGALVAWLATWLLDDLGGFVSSYARLDLAAGMMLGAGIGAFVGAGAGIRRGEGFGRAALLGAALGTLGAAAGAALGTTLGRALWPAPGQGAFLAWRTLGWALLGAGLGVALGAMGWRTDRRRVLDAALAGTAAGVFAGVVFSLPGASDLWQALAFAVVGAGVGWGTAGPSLARSLGVLELERTDPRRAGLLALREWGLAEGTVIDLPQAIVYVTEGRCAVAPRGAAAVTVSGRALLEPAELRDGDRIEAGRGSYRFRRWTAAMLLLLCAFGTRMSAAQAQPGDAGRAEAVSVDTTAPRLVRCVAGRGLPCLRSTVSLRPGEGAPDSAGWAGRLGPLPLRAPMVRASAPAEPVSLLVLVDVSGSMAGGGMQAARSSLRGFLGALPAGSARVAVAPFSSVQVQARIRQARFVPPAEAARQVDYLPVPQGNTGLYTAVVTGLEVLERERGARALLVITDGRNDVAGAGDDPGLLAGPEGQRGTTERVRGSGIPLYLVGFGTGVDANELRLLASSPGRDYTVPEDPVALARAFGRVGAELGATRELTWVLPVANRGWLARGALPYGAWSVPEEGGVRRDARWIPPLFALPAFAGVADSAAAAGWALQGDAGTAWRRAVILLALAGVLGLLWIGVPRWTWAAAADPGPVPAPRPRTIPLPGRGAPEPVAAGGLRTDLREAPPRRPADTTANAARRVARGQGGI